MIRDAIREAARELWVWTAAGALLLVLFVPAVAGLGIAVQSRGTLDGVLAGTWVLAMLAALRLGGRLAGDGLRAYVVPGVGETRWLACRGVGFGVVLAAMIVVVLGTCLSLAPVRGAAGLAVHAGSCFLEAWVWMWAAALLSIWARPWLAAAAVVCLGWVGHVEQDLVGALAWWGLDGVGRVAMLLLPSFEGTDVQGAIVAGVELSPTPILVGAAQLLCWSMVLAGATGMSMARRDRLP